MASGETEPTLREYFAMIFRRKFSALVVCLLTAGAIAAGAHYVPPTFTAEASLIVKFGREFIYRPEVGQTERSVRFSVEEMVNSEAEILGSRDLARQVVDEIGAKTLYPNLREEQLSAEMVVEKATSALDAAIVVSPVVDSSILRVSFEHEDPKIAARSVNLLIEKFRDKHLEIFSDTTSAFLDAQVTKYREELSAAEEALESFKKSRDIHALDEQRNLLFSRRLALEQQLLNTDLGLSELQGKYLFLNGDSEEDEEDKSLDGRVPPEKKTFLVSQWNDLQSTFNTLDLKISELEKKRHAFKRRKQKKSGHYTVHPGAGNSRSLDESLVRLLELQLKERELLRTYDRDTREVRGIRREIALVEDFIKERGREIEVVIGAGITDELNALKAQRKAISASIETLDQEIQSFGMQEVLEQLAPLEAKKEKIVVEIDRLGKDLRTLNEHEKELRKLKRDVMLGERSFQTYLERFEEARINAELDKQKRINVQVVQKAFPPVSPSGLSKDMKIALGILVGIVAGVCVAFFLELIAPVK